VRAVLSGADASLSGADLAAAARRPRLRPPRCRNRRGTHRCHAPLVQPLKVGEPPPHGHVLAREVGQRRVRLHVIPRVPRQPAAVQRGRGDGDAHGVLRHGRVRRVAVQVGVDVVVEVGHGQHLGHADHGADGGLAALVLHRRDELARDQPVVALQLLLGHAARRNAPHLAQLLVGQPRPPQEQRALGAAHLLVVVAAGAGEVGRRERWKGVIGGGGVSCAR
jgi:hypothetical protein